jgi:polysaccharide deacetylase family protein (PEP-CTERM system associated)
MKSGESAPDLLTLDVEEWFHAHNYRDHVVPSSWDTRERRAAGGVEALLRLCEELGGPATWFVLGWTAERDPGLVREIVSAGHEVGCHTYAHPVAYELDRDAFRDDTRRGRDAVAEACGIAPVAYRAASFTIVPRNYWALEILREEGFRIDCSLFPVAHPRYGNPNGPRSAFRFGRGDDGDLVVVPMTTLRLPGRNFPFSGGGYFRLFPAPLLRACASWVRRVQSEQVIWYFHPWELDSYRPDVDLGMLQNLRSQGGKRDLHGKLRGILDGRPLVTISDFVASIRDDLPVLSESSQIPPRSPAAGQSASEGAAR